MKTITEQFMDKSKWGEGPWQEEPDKVQWQDEETGLPCLIVRNMFGALCGYVGVTKSHPYFKKSYEKLDLNAHGGLTFSDLCQPDGHICHVVDDGEDDNVWWLGFDCGHFDDLSPGLMATINAAYKHAGEERTKLGTFDEVYRDLDYVKQEVRDLAKQLRDA